MNMSEIGYLSFDHNRPLAEMSGEEVLKEYSYLFSGCADDLEPRKGVKLGLRPELVARMSVLEKHLIAAVNFTQL